MPIASTTHLLREVAERRLKRRRAEAPTTGDGSSTSPEDVERWGEESAARFHARQLFWMRERIGALPSVVEQMTPSVWAEKRRYLPPSVSPMPGFYRYDYTPYLREIVDCFAPDSPVRAVAVMKGVQIGATAGVLENVLGFLIDHVKVSPVLFVTATQDLTQLRLDQHILPMVANSGLAHLIQSGDVGNRRKTGKTAKKIEWIGGGWLYPLGAKNAPGMRSQPVPYLLRDEVDGWPLRVGGDGDPLELTEARTKAYEGIRKILDLSTPTLEGQSRIDERFKLGDQRFYFVCCLKCNYPQRLRWSHLKDTGERAGIVWEMNGEQLVPGSVRYLCQECLHPHTNDDKTRLLDPANGAEWRPTAVPSSPFFRSYHLNALYSPVGMGTWESAALEYLKGWDPVANRMRDAAKFQVFQNNIRGRPFRIEGDRILYEIVSPHRRDAYRYGQVPNAFASQHAASAVLVLTAAVDVHGDCLKLAIFGWTRGRRAFLVSYETLEGDTRVSEDPGTWGALEEIIDSRRYTADDGKRYPISITLIDASWNTDAVYAFCAKYQNNVHPIMGRRPELVTSTNQEFSRFVNRMGTVAFYIVVDRYKDRWSGALRKEWDGVGVQPVGMFNAPADATEEQLRELTREVKREKRDPVSRQLLGVTWVRPSGAANELWDLLVYNSAAVDILAWIVCREYLQAEYVNWPGFWDLAESNALFLEEAKPGVG